MSAKPSCTIACDFIMKICYVNRTLYFCALVFFCNFFACQKTKKHEGLGPIYFQLVRTLDLNTAYRKIQQTMPGIGVPCIMDRYTTILPTTTVNGRRTATRKLYNKFEI
jgi:hypothetical protein